MLLFNAGFLPHAAMDSGSRHQRQAAMNQWPAANTRIAVSKSGVTPKYHVRARGEENTASILGAGMCFFLKKGS
jgi:hypothetical protein